MSETAALLTYERQAQAEGKAILFEGQLGALRDLDYGIYPYTTSWGRSTLPPSFSRPGSISPD